MTLSLPTFKLPPYSLSGYSLGGLETAHRIQELRLAIDVGLGRRALLSCDHLALTHTHMDHMAGVPNLLALRQLFRMKPPTLYVPFQMVDAVKRMLASWYDVQRYHLEASIVPTKDKEEIRLGQNVCMRPFRTYHTVPSNGYSIILEKRKLKPAYHGLPGRELAALKESGTDIDELLRRPLLSITGDTLVAVLEKQEQILSHENLVLECTFLDDKKSLENSRAGGHIHLSELMERSSLFQNKRLILSHISQLYGEEDILRLLKPLASRIESELWVFPREPGQDFLFIPKD